MSSLGLSSEELIAFAAVAALIISICGFVGNWYLLGFRVKLIEKWIANHVIEIKERNRELTALTEVGVKLTVLNEQTERRIHMLEELLIIQQRNTR